MRAILRVCQTLRSRRLVSDRPAPSVFCTTGATAHKRGRTGRRTRTAMHLLLPLLALAASCTEPNPYLGICGNGAVEPDFGEDCDDGDDNGDSKACTATCKLATCGDGLVQTGVEQCDLGGLGDLNSDCTPDCQIKDCGDGIVQFGEECDDGGLNRWPPDGQGGCSIYCSKLPECGNGEPEEGEQCDDGNDDDGDACLTSCLLATCGDGFVQEGVEECDDGNESDNDLCPTTCLFAQCGDSLVLEGVEECDDGNNSNSDACLGTCLAATCGDGVLQEGVEECDDGNLDPDDGCNASCIADREVFVTKQFLNAGELMGIDGADAICKSEAEMYGLPKPDRYVAWLSDSKSSPATRFQTRTARYVLVGGSLIADDWDDLTDGQLSHAIDRDATGELVNNTVWTATTVLGEAVDTGEFCSDWLADDDSVGRVGTSSEVDFWWTNAPQPAFCLTARPIYCFQD